MKIYLLIASLFLTSCFPIGDLLPDFVPFTKELSLEAKTLCVKDNPSRSVEECDVKKCFASPLTLIAMQELLIEAGQVLTEVGLTWVIEAGSGIAAERFNAHLPWDDDVDLGVFKEDINETILMSIEGKLREKGLDFKPLFGTSMMQNITGYQGLYQVAYGESRFYRLILSENPSINKVDLRNLWLRYTHGSSMLPHLDVFLYEEKSPGRYAYESSHFNVLQLKNRTFPKEVLVPAKTISVLGRSFPTVANIVEYGKIAYQTDDIVNNFYVNRNHSAGCKPLNFPDIRKHPELLNFILDYLEFSYARPAAVALGLKFDRGAVYNRFFP